MPSYNVEPCTFIYRVSSLAKVVDGDTIDVNIDLGFDVSITSGGCENSLL